MTQNVGRAKLQSLQGNVNVTITEGVLVLHIKWVKAYIYITKIKCSCLNYHLKYFQHLWFASFWSQNYVTEFCISNRPGLNQIKYHTFSIAVGQTNKHNKTFKYIFEDMTSIYSHLLWSITYSWPTSLLFDAPVMHCGTSVS